MRRRSPEALLWALRARPGGGLCDTPSQGAETVPGVRRHRPMAQGFDGELPRLRRYGEVVGMKKTHCKHGHEIAVVGRDTTGQCRECRREQGRVRARVENLSPKAHAYKLKTQRLKSLSPHVCWAKDCDHPAHQLPNGKFSPQCIEHIRESNRKFQDQRRLSPHVCDAQGCNLPAYQLSGGTFSPYCTNHKRETSRKYGKTLEGYLTGRRHQIKKLRQKYTNRLEELNGNTAH